MALYIIEFESAYWCGGVSHCVAEASNEIDAEGAAECHMRDTIRDLFYDDDYEDEVGPDGDPSDYTVNWVEILNESNEYWKYYQDPSQASFYPKVN